MKNHKTMQKVPQEPIIAAFGSFLGGLGESGNKLNVDALHWGVQWHPQHQFLNSSNDTTQPSSAVSLWFILHFKKQILKAKDSFRKQGKTLSKARGSFQCASLYPATTAIQGASKHFLNLAAAKGSLSQTCQTQRIPSFHTALDQLCKASGRLLCWPHSSQHCQTYFTCARVAWSGMMPRQATLEELYQQSYSCP